MKKWLTLSLPALLLIFAFAASAWAFQDTGQTPGKDQIDALMKQGVIAGTGDDKFKPDEKLTFAQGAALLVRGLRLNIDSIRFIKQPRASDFFTHVPDEAWYAKLFITAQLNQVQFPEDVVPNDAMTREQFAHYLYNAILSTGDYAFTLQAAVIADGEDITPAWMNDIQTLLNAHIATLDDQARFRPKAGITRAEAAVMLYNAMDFVKNQGMKPSDQPPADRDVTMNIEAVNDEVNRVTLSWGEKPTTGYIIRIDGIAFTPSLDDDTAGTAVIRYSLQNPLPGMMQGQIVTHPQAVAYVSSKYKAVLAPVPTSVAGSTPQRGN